MDMRRKYYLLFIIVCTHFILFAQMPEVDPNWRFVADSSDNFTYDSGGGPKYENGISAAKWQLMNYCNCDTFPSYGGSSAWNRDYAYDSTIGTNGYLMLKVDSSLNHLSGAWSCCGVSGNCNFNTGGVASKYLYPYGYFEMYAKLPGYIDGSGNAHGDKFWPAYWMAYAPYCSKWDEIDMIDDCCCSTYQKADSVVTGWGYPAATSGPDTCNRLGTKSFSTASKVPLCNAFHKYAVEWNTNRLAFYHDDTLYHQELNVAGLTMYPMQLFMDLQLYCGCTFYPGSFSVPTHHSQFMTIDYFHYYRLKHDCGNNITFFDDAQISSYSYAVEKSITFGNGSNAFDLSMCTPATGYSDFIFRAVNGFTIPNYGYSFKVPAGTVMMLIPTACN